MEVIDSILSIYGCMSADDLTDITHEENSLWSRVVAEHKLSFENESKSNVAIPLTMLNEGDTEKMETYDDARWNIEFQALLNN